MVSFNTAYRVSKAVYLKHFRNKWRRTKKKVFAKYGKKCCICGTTRNIQVHHIFSKHDHPNKRHTIKWLRPVCKECHKGFHIFNDGFDKSCTYKDWLDWLDFLQIPLTPKRYY